MLITWLSEKPEVYRVLKPYLQPEDLSDELYSKILKMLYEQLENGNVNPAVIIGRFESEEEQKEVALSFSAILPLEAPKAEQEKTLKELLINVRTDGINNRLQQASGSEDELEQMIAIKQETEKLNRLNLRL